MNSITTHTKRTLSGLIAALFALSLVAIPSAALAASPSFGPEATNTSQSIFVGEGLTALTVSNPDGEPLNFTGGGLPVGITMNADGTFFGVATTAGIFYAVIRVCNPSACANTFLTVTVSGDPNNTPFFTPDSTNWNQSIAVGDGLTALTAFDPNGDPLTFSGQGELPDGITLNADGTFSGVATTVGVSYLSPIVFDPFGNYSFGSLTVTVSAGSPPTQAQTKEDCKDGVWAAFGFDNQGLCIKFVQTGGDTR